MTLAIAAIEELPPADQLYKLRDAELEVLLARVDRGELGLADLPDAEYEAWRSAAWVCLRRSVLRGRRNARDEAENNGLSFAGDIEGRNLPAAPPAWFWPGKGDGRLVEIVPVDDRPPSSGDPAFPRVARVAKRLAAVGVDPNSDNSQ